MIVVSRRADSLRFLSARASTSTAISHECCSYGRSSCFLPIPEFWPFLRWVGNPVAEFQFPAFAAHEARACGTLQVCGDSLSCPWGQEIRVQVHVSRSLSNSTISLRYLVLSADAKQLLEQIRKLCGKISVAKVNLSPSPTPLILIIRSVNSKQKETFQLAVSCKTLSDRLGDGSLKSPNPEDVQRPAHHPLSIYLPVDVMRQ